MALTALEVLVVEWSIADRRVRKAHTDYNREVATRGMAAEKTGERLSAECSRLGEMEMHLRAAATEIMTHKPVHAVKAQGTKG